MVTISRKPRLLEFLVSFSIFDCFSTHCANDVEVRDRASDFLQRSRRSWQIAFCSTGFKAFSWPSCTMTIACSKFPFSTTEAHQFSLCLKCRYMPKEPSNSVCVSYRELTPDWSSSAIDTKSHEVFRNKPTHTLFFPFTRGYSTSAWSIYDRIVSNEQYCFSIW